MPGAQHEEAATDVTNMLAPDASGFPGACDAIKKHISPVHRLSTSAAAAAAVAADSPQGSLTGRSGGKAVRLASFGDDDDGEYLDCEARRFRNRRTYCSMSTAASLREVSTPASNLGNSYNGNLLDGDYGEASSSGDEGVVGESKQEAGDSAPASSAVASKRCSEGGRSCRSSRGVVFAEEDVERSRKSESSSRSSQALRKGTPANLNFGAQASDDLSSVSSGDEGVVGEGKREAGDLAPASSAVASKRCSEGGRSCRSSRGVAFAEEDVERSRKSESSGRSSQALRRGTPANLNVGALAADDLSSVSSGDEGVVGEGKREAGDSAPASSAVASKRCSEGGRSCHSSRGVAFAEEDVERSRKSESSGRSSQALRKGTPFNLCCGAKPADDLSSVSSGDEGNGCSAVRFDEGPHPGEFPTSSMGKRRDTPAVVQRPAVFDASAFAGSEMCGPDEDEEGRPSDFRHALNVAQAKLSKATKRIFPTFGGAVPPAAFADEEEEEEEDEDEDEDEDEEEEEKSRHVVSEASASSASAPPAKVAAALLRRSFATAAASAEAAEVAEAEEAAQAKAEEMEERKAAAAAREAAAEGTEIWSECGGWHYRIPSLGTSASVEASAAKAAIEAKEEVTEVGFVLGDPLVLNNLRWRFGPSGGAFVKQIGLHFPKDAPVSVGDRLLSINGIDCDLRPEAEIRQVYRQETAKLGEFLFQFAHTA